MLPNPKRFTPAQHRFLRACRNECSDLPELIRREQIPAWRLARWFRLPRFRAEMTQVLLSVRRRRELDLALASKRAAHLLAKTVAQTDGVRGLTRDQAEICIALIELARRREPRESPAQRDEFVKAGR